MLDFLVPICTLDDIIMIYLDQSKASVRKRVEMLVYNIRNFQFCTFAANL